jgi:N-methylhydantoinase B
VSDTGGPGRMRGGASTGLAMVPYDVEGLDAMVIGHGIQVPNSIGLFGGLPGACASHLLRRSEEGAPELIRAYRDWNSIANDPLVRNLGAKPGGFRLGSGDVFAYAFQGGGGYGDPLDRDPSRVARDVTDGRVTSMAAGDLYGVVFDKLTAAVDAAATKAKRQAIRLSRLDQNSVGIMSLRPGEGIPQEMEVTAGNRFRCGCGHDLGSAASDWKAHTSNHVVSAESVGPHIVLHDLLELRAFVCPICAGLLEVEVCQKDQASLTTINLAALTEATAT